MKFNRVNKMKRINWLAVYSISHSILAQNNNFQLHPTPDLSHPHLAKTRVYRMVRPGPNFMPFISLLINPAFNKPVFSSEF